MFDGSTYGPALESYAEFLLAPYSPDLSPIEKCWSNVQARLRKAKARTFDELIVALADALHAVSKRDAAAWFAHWGHAVSP